ncbi:7906_t:CDS:2, partial [Dentiscutata heterogama]
NFAVRDHNIIENVSEVYGTNTKRNRHVSDKKSEGKVYQVTNKAIVHNKNKEFPQPIFNENAVKYLKLNHSLIIKSQEMCTAVNQAFNFDSRMRKDIEGCHIKLVLPKDRKELFLLKNNIDVASFQLLPQKLVKIMMQSTTFLNDNSSFNHVHLEVKFPKIELNFEKKNIKPTEEIKISINNALKNEKPYQELIKVFDTFGYLLSQKLILGQKLYKSCVSLQKPSSTDNQQEIELTIEEFFENYLSKLDNMSKKYGFNATYFISINGEAIRINGIEKWLNEYSKLLQVIGRSELLPVYEIFEESISCKIQSILGIDNQKKILMTGVTQFVENTKYYHMDFPSNLESCNYQIFAKVIRYTNKELMGTIDNAIVKIHSKSRTGFFVAIENINGINVDPIDLQIMWILVGFPDEINFYSVHTRELVVLSMEDQNITLEADKKTVIINVPKELPKNSIMTLSFEYPLSNNNLEIQDGKNL